MTDLVPHQPQPPQHAWIELVRPAADLAKEIAGTEFVPKEMRNRPAMIAACVLFGAELGLGPMVSLAKIAIVQGRPAPYAELARALALGAGHEIWVDEQTNTRCKVSGRRRGSQQIFTATWTSDDVKRAGISNPNYAKYPRQMLHARASAELVRMMAPDVLGGITVFAEEAADIDDERIVATVAASGEIKPKAGNVRRRRQPEAEEPASDETQPVDPEPVDDDKPSAAQTRMAMAEFTEVGIIDRADRLAATSAMVGRAVGSWSELSRGDASTVIDGLGRIKAGTVSFVVADDGTWSMTVTDDGAAPALPDEATP